MKTSELVELINDATDPFCGLRFPYIMDLNDEDKWEEIQECMCAYKIACAIENGRFCKNDRYMIVVDDGPIIYTFSDNETLFGYISPADIAQLFQENDIELTIKPIHHDD